MVYFAPEPAEEYAGLGLAGTEGYFASRSAPLGAASAELVIATFYNFNPELVRRAIPRAWSLASPEEILAARLRGVDRALRTMLGSDVESAEIVEASGIARDAAEAAAQRPEGRPLFAAHAALPWPTDAHLVLWHAQSLLREYRGDGHIAALVVHQLGPVEALLLHAASGDVAGPTLQATRAWGDSAWAESLATLQGRGVLSEGDDLVLTDAGVELHSQIEDLTDELAVLPYEAIGEDGSARLRQLVRPYSQTVARLAYPRMFPPSTGDG